MSELNLQAIIKQVNAILGEAQVTPKSGRMHPDVGIVPPNQALTRLIDHTLLKPEATARQIEMLCLEAKEYHFASACINTAYVPLAAEILRGTEVKVGATVGFPLGAMLPAVKAFEAEAAIKAGATEVDMVIHVGTLKNRDLVALFEDISDVVGVCHEADILCKVILETCLLSKEEIVIGAQVAKLAGADFVKTSTGFSTGGASVEDVALMRSVVGEGVGVKASGGVRSVDDFKAMLKAGANRVGTSAGVSIAKALAGESVNAPSNGNY